MFYSPLEQFEILYTIIPQTVCMILTDISDVSLNFNLFLKNNYFLFLKDNFISISFLVFMRLLKLKRLDLLKRIL